MLALGVRDEVRVRVYGGVRVKFIVRLRIRVRVRGRFGIRVIIGG